MDRLYIIIPAYNEEENIRQVVSDWYPVIADKPSGSRLVVIDDGSLDHTYSILSEMQQTYPRLVALTKENSGHGSTILYGYRYALENHADYVFQTDSDGQTNPQEFLQFWEIRSLFGMIIGHRRDREDGFSRVIVTKVLKTVLFFSFGVRITDANTPFRLMEVQELERNLKYIPDDFFLANVMISVLCEKRGVKTHYIPITFRPRQGGTNSINLKRIIRIGIQSIKDFSKIKHMWRQNCNEIYK
ncbi:MAG: glycosyltransferase family 2 protein [Lachnospiraceae bacterium]|nr:glycosyltransferase family 2 protein [Lachnospiraceae bacterium]